MSSFFFHPGLFVAGLIAVAVPILIHLLNRRRFRRVDWAPMDFLLKAQQINRRRIKFEDFLLLLLRCLAVALIGMLVARPFLANDKSGALRQLARSERVIVIDDSASMNAQSGGVSSMVKAKDLLRSWIAQLSSEQPNDTVTIALTSAPDKLLANGVPLSENAAADLLEEVENLSTSDISQSMESALGKMERLFSGEGGSQANRVLYVLTDLRERDWPTSGGGTFDVLSRLASKAAGCYVVDVGSEETENLVIESIAPREKAFVSGAPAEFDVIVRNFGRRPATGVTVRLGTDEGLPVERTIDRIEPGQSGVAGFVYTFGAADGEGAVEPVALTAKLGGDSDDFADALPSDNERFFAANVSEGLRVLLVDGDITAKAENSESFFLRKALSPRGALKSGFVVTVIDEAALATEDLSAQDVVVLANVFRLDEERRSKIEAWTRDGGGLMVSLGDHVDDAVYNESLFAEGGVGGMKIVGVQGDPSEEEWLQPVITDEAHPAFRFFTGENRRWLERIKFFQWWKLEITEQGEEEGPVDRRVLARLGGSEGDPLLVDAPWGEGRVMTVASALDLDWNTWAQEGVPYVIAMQEICRYLARSNVLEGEVVAGDSLKVSFDIARYRMDAEVVMPGGQTETLRAAPSAEASRTSEWWLDFGRTNSRGHYRVELTPSGAGGAKEARLFSVNADESEGNLFREDVERMDALLETSGAKLVTAEEKVLSLGGMGAKVEFWRAVLYLLIAVLCVEMCFAWWIGKRR
ncbi:MAG: BatA domain-containing protein [Verrucomicrobiota bacterium]